MKYNELNSNTKLYLSKSQITSLSNGNIKFNVLDKNINDSINQK
jgi:hypothetical protein